MCTYANPVRSFRERFVYMGDKLSEIWDTILLYAFFNVYI